MYRIRGLGSEMRGSDMTVRMSALCVEMTYPLLPNKTILTAKMFSIAILCYISITARF